MYSTNKEIKSTAKQRGVHLYEVAQRMGMNDSAFSRKLRQELVPEEKQKIMDIIDRLSREKLEVV